MHWRCRHEVMGQMCLETALEINLLSVSRLFLVTHSCHVPSEAFPTHPSKRSSQPSGMCPRPDIFYIESLSLQVSHFLVDF